MSEEDLPTGPGHDAPKARTLTDEIGDLLSNLLDVKLKPIADDSQAVREIARKIFDEFHKVVFRFEKRLEEVERRMTHAELEIGELKELISKPPGGA